MFLSSKNPANLLKFRYRRINGKTCPIVLNVLRICKQITILFRAFAKETFHAQRMKYVLLTTNQIKIVISASALKVCYYVQNVKVIFLNKVVYCSRVKLLHGSSLSTKEPKLHLYRDCILVKNTTAKILGRQSTRTFHLSCQFPS